MKLQIQTAVILLIGLTFNCQAQFYNDLRCEFYFTDLQNNKDTLVFGLSMDATEGFTPNLDVLDTTSINNQLEVRLINTEVQNEIGGNCFNLKEDFKQLNLPSETLDYENFVYEFQALIKHDSLIYIQYQMEVAVNNQLLKNFETNNDLGLNVSRIDFESPDYSLTTSNAVGFPGTSIFPQNADNIESFVLDA